MATATAAKPKAKFFYGWWIMIALMLTYTLCMAQNWTSTMIFPFLQKEMGWTATTLGMFTAIRSYIGVLWYPLTGYLTNKFGNKNAMIWGFIAGGIGVMLYTTVTADNAWLMILYWPGLMSFGVFLCSTIGINTLPRKWFIKNSSLAMGMIGSFWGFGSSVIFPAMSSLAASYGWRNAIYIVIPLATILGLAITIPIIKNSPEERGLNMDGMSDEELKRMREASAKAGSSQEQAFTLKQAFKTYQFWVMLAAYGIGGSISISFIQGFSTLIAISVGVPAALAGVGMSALMIPGIFGRLIIGPIGDRWGKREMIIVTSFLSAVIYFIGYFWIHDAVSVFVILGALGLVMMDDLTLMPPFIGDLVGRKNLPIIWGFFYGINSIVSGTLSWIMGSIVTSTGGYIVPLGLLGIGMVLSGILVFFARPTEVERINMAFKKKTVEKK
jgi:MFS family permease